MSYEPLLSSVAQISPKLVTKPANISSVPLSPIDDMDVPDKLRARVVSPGPVPTVFGYDLGEDIAKNYSFAELVYLSLVGEAPDRRFGQLFDKLLTLASAVTIAEAPVHAASLAALCGASQAGMAATGAIALTEQSRWLTANHGSLLQWLEQAPQQTPAQPPPAQFLNQNDAARVAVLKKHADRCGVTIAALEHALSWPAALIAAFHHCGLKQVSQIEAALCCARWPLLMAEANAARAGSLRDYPIRTPAFRWSTPSEADAARGAP